MNFKKLAAKFFLVCFLISTTQYAYSQSMLEQLKDLHLQKKQGWLTDQQFEEKKKAIIDSHSPTAKKKAAEKAKKLAEKQKQEKIKQQKAKALALKEYSAKFPLHAAIKVSDLALIETILKNNPQQINIKDNKGKTAWDVVYEQDKFIMLPYLLAGIKTIENSPNVSFEAGVNYNIGGWQPVIGVKFILLQKVQMLYQQQKELLETHSSSVSLLSDLNDTQHFLLEGIQKTIKLILKTTPVIQTAETNSRGKSQFKNVAPGEYIIFGITSTRGGYALWYYPIKVVESDLSVLLDTNKAIIAF
jgi:hypothetical protein